MPTNKTIPTSENVENYLRSIENVDQQADARVLVEIMQQATGAEAVMWGSSIIGFGTYHYQYATGREGDTVAVGFSARKIALTIYGLFHYEHSTGNIELAKKLGTHTHGKGCVYIKRLSDVNQDILVRMIQNAYTERNNTNRV